MCGIVGFASQRPLLPVATLLAMRDCLQHRGPDAHGCVAWDPQGRPAPAHDMAAVALAHRRLSIIDLSSAAAQPMANENHSVWLTYNGEFYNFQAYRAELEQAGHQFRSRSDTETILHLYEQYGIRETLTRINGMFAFGLWDQSRRELFLARDRAGKKPLYYMVRPDGSILFASEMKALVASGLVDRNSWDEVGLDQIWSFGFTAGERTLYRQIRKLMPGHYLHWRDGRIQIHEYWDCPFGVNPFSGRSDESLADELEALLTDAIRLRLIADVPTGVFLSGGVDSSLVAALAARVTGHGIKSYTIGFARQDHDESPYAREIAAALRIENITLRVDAEFASQAAEVARAFDEPFGDSSALPTWCVAQLARQHVTVALTGDGGDELFAGYDRQSQALRLWGSSQERLAAARPLLRSERVWELRQRLAGFRRGYPSLERQLSRRNRWRIFQPHHFARLCGADAFADRWHWFERVKQADRLSQVQYLIFKTWLPDDYLRKVDTASMAHSLECRCPLLDHRIIEFAARLPFEQKLQPGSRGKLILRRLLRRHIPPALFERPKQGFTIPWEDMCQGEFGAGLRHEWRHHIPPPFRTEAADLLFPQNQTGSNFMTWTAFATLRCLTPSR